MRVVQTDSQGPAHFIAFAVSLVKFVSSEFIRSKEFARASCNNDSLSKLEVEQLKKACRAIWPDCDIYQGGTHIRVTPAGAFKHCSPCPSFYVDLSGERRAP